MSPGREGLAEALLSHRPAGSYTPGPGAARAAGEIHPHGMFIRHRQPLQCSATISAVTTDVLLSTISEYLYNGASSVVMEDGAVIFDLAESKYSVTGEPHKCLLHLWSAEKNIVRRVLAVERKPETLRITVQRMGHNRLGTLDICRRRDRASASAMRTARLAYRTLLERVLQRNFPDSKLVQLTVAIDLEKSFGPSYARGLLKRGQSGFAVLGVSAQEAQASVDAALTFGILWLETCRLAHAGSLVIEGLNLFVPAGTSALVRERMAHLNPAAAKWRLHELNQRDEELQQVEILDRGNISTRLVRSVDDLDVHARFAEPISLVRSLMPGAQIATLTPAEISFACNGLAFARARLSATSGNFSRVPEVVFGIGAEERLLDGSSFSAFERLVAGIGEVRHSEGPRDHRLWRMHPERWLESLVVQNVGALERELDPEWRYSQVPAFCASDRAMIDVLAVTRGGRLAVLELKADEDIHLPLQGIDYWARVAWHHERGEFQKLGYFTGCELSTQPPLLIMVAPALHLHPATDTLLRYISPEIEWRLLGIDERWRAGLKVIFRKRRQGKRQDVA
jgi:hypothetical protein